MLVLGRKTRERIVIGEGRDQVIVTVVAIEGDRVRIGLEGRREITIRRAEPEPAA